MARLTVWVVGTLLGLAVSAQAGWCPLSPKACGIEGLSSDMLEGIIQIESGGWPFALRLNVGGKGVVYYAESIEEAEVALGMFLKASSNVDIGLMQVNWRWWGGELSRYGIEPRDLLNPRVNVTAGCYVLARVFGERGDASFERRLGWYHSRRPSRGEWYAARVRSIAAEVERKRTERAVK